MTLDFVNREKERDVSRVYFRRFEGIREGTESGEDKRKETMLEGNGKCCWKDAAWNAREGGEKTYLLLLFYEPTIRFPIYAPSFPSLSLRNTSATSS